MNRSLRASTVLLALSAVVLAAVPTATSAAAKVVTAVIAAVPAAPGEPELVAGADSSITVEFDAVQGATRYNIYRGTSSGGQGATPIASTTENDYKDTNLSLMCPGLRGAALVDFMPRAVRWVAAFHTRSG